MKKDGEDNVTTLKKQIKQLKEDNKKLSADYELVMKQWQISMDSSKKFQELYEQEKNNNPDISMYQNIINTLTKKVEKLQKLLDEKPSSGRKRKNGVADAEIIKLSGEGKSLRTISKETGLSVNTIRGILKGVSK
jgi:predicted RNase H-like nuclease (RuvC/YqgF family)